MNTSKVARRSLAYCLLLVLLIGCSVSPRTPTETLRYQIKGLETPSTKRTAIKPRVLDYNQTIRTASNGYVICRDDLCRDVYKSPILNFVAFAIEQEVTYLRGGEILTKETYFPTNMNTDYTAVVTQAGKEVGACAVRLHQSSITLRLYTERCDLTLNTRTGLQGFTTSGRIFLTVDREPVDVNGVLITETGAQIKFRATKQ